MGLGYSIIHLIHTTLTNTQYIHTYTYTYSTYIHAFTRTYIYTHKQEYIGPVEPDEDEGLDPPGHLVNRTGYAISRYCPEDWPPQEGCHQEGVLVGAAK